MAELLLGILGLLVLVGGVLGIAALVEMIRSPYKN
jgi:hypothetical protein